MLMRLALGALIAFGIAAQAGAAPHAGSPPAAAGTEAALPEKPIRDPRRARAALQRALTEARNARDRARVAELLSRLAETYIESGEFKPALRLAEEAVVTAERAKSRRVLAAALGMRGDVRIYLGEHQLARDDYLASLRLSREEGDWKGEADANKNLGIALKYAGRYEEALARLEEALAVYRSHDDRYGIVSAVENLGTAYMHLGDPQRALESFQEALEIGRPLADDWLTQHALIRIGILYLTAGRPGEAMRHLEMALPIVRDLGLRVQERWILMGLSRALDAMGRTEEALALQGRVIRLSERTGSEMARAERHAELGALHLRHDPATALEHLMQALALAEDLELPAPWVLEARIARAQRSMGDLDSGIAWYQRAIARVESTGNEIVSDDLRSAFLESHHGIYRELIEALLERAGRDGSEADVLEAFRTLERAKARALSEAIRAPGGDASLRIVSASRARDLLEPGTALISYCATGRAFHAFVLTRDALRVVRLATGPDQVEARIETLLDLIARGRGDGWMEVAERLRADLVDPVRAILPRSVTRIMVAPDGYLHFLPFEVLPSPAGGYLQDELVISYIPSASVLALLRDAVDRPSAHGRMDLFMVANPVGDETPSATMRGLYEDEGIRIPALPYSVEEAAAVRRLVGRGSEILVGTAATESRVKAARLERFRVLHFATHALVSHRWPARSALLLSPDGTGSEDGLLQAREVLRMKLDADLIVLSACRTARGRVLQGEGVQGLSQAFLHAGARTVVATLWDVDDDRTAMLMSRFYAGLARGRTVAEALNGAKRDLAGRKATASPIYWAGFIAIGAADGSVRLAPTPIWSRHAARAAAGAGGAALAWLLILIVLRRRRSIAA